MDAVTNLGVKILMDMLNTAVDKLKAVGNAEVDGGKTAGNWFQGRG